MFGGLLRDIRGEIRAVGGAARLQFGNLLRAEPGGVLGVRFLSGLGFLFGIFFFEDGAAEDGIGVCLGGGFFVLCLHETGSQTANLILGQIENIIGLMVVPLTLTATSAA